MEKIDFVNSTQPALNDTNLNLMQDNIERAINAQVSGDTLPIGTMLPFAGVTIPENWLLCDGRAISRTTYAQLYNVIGTRYGTGDGSTTFNLPNMKGRVPVGYDATQTEFNTTGKTGGEKKHTLTIQEMPAHNHSAKVKMNAGGFGDGYLTTASGYDYSSSSSPIENTGGGQAHNILQPYLVQRFIIKANQTAGTVAQILNTQSNSTTDAYSCNYINSRVDVSSLITKSSKVGTVSLKQAYKKGNRVYFSAQFEILQEGAGLFTIDSSLKPIYAEVGSGTNYQSGASVPMIVKVSANGSSIDSNVYASSVLSSAAIHIEWEV